MLNSLPDYLRLELKPDFKGLMHIHGMAFFAEASKPKWNERHNAVCMDIRFKALSLRGRKVKSHVLRIAFKGYETSIAMNYGENKRHGQRNHGGENRNRCNKLRGHGGQGKAG
jgi:hypothetical protein